MWCISPTFEHALKHTHPHTCVSLLFSQLDWSVSTACATLVSSQLGFENREGALAATVRPLNEKLAMAQANVVTFTSMYTRKYICNIIPRHIGSINDSMTTWYEIVWHTLACTVKQSRSVIAQREASHGARLKLHWANDRHYEPSHIYACSHHQCGRSVKSSPWPSPTMSPLPVCMHAHSQRHKSQKSLRTFTRFCSFFFPPFSLFFFFFFKISFYYFLFITVYEMCFLILLVSQQAKCACRWRSL